MKPYLIALLCLFVYSGVAKFYKEEEFTQSLQTWNNLKPANYKYTVVLFLRDNIGRTTLKVKNGKVIERSYKETTLFHVPGEFVNAWTEKCASVGTHTGVLDYYDIVPAVTLDEVYAYCRDQVLTQDQDPADEEFSQVVFETDDKGLIANCVFYPAFCFDCAWSVYVENIEF